MTRFQKFKVRQYVSKAINATFWNVLGTVLPLILCSIILMAYSKTDRIINFIDRGDFCLYSAGLLSGALFVLSDNKENIKNWYNSILYPSAFLLIIIAATLYCAIYIGGDLLKEQVKIDMSTSFVHKTSFILILSSLVITFRSLMIDFKYRPPKVNVIEKQEKSVNDIMDQLGK